MGKEQFNISELQTCESYVNHNVSENSARATRPWAICESINLKGCSNLLRFLLGGLLLIYLQLIDSSPFYSTEFLALSGI